jgi:hypothetical protein
MAGMKKARAQADTHDHGRGSSEQSPITVFHSGLQVHFRPSLRLRIAPNSATSSFFSNAFMPK